MLDFLNGFRKWSMAVIFLVVAVSLLVADVIPGNDWLKHVSSVMVAFMATNVGEHIVKTVQGYFKNGGSDAK